MTELHAESGDIHQVDKTIVEGAEDSGHQPLSGPTALTAGARATLSSDSTGAAKTVAGTSSAFSGALQLPEEGESVALGSGTTVAILGSGGMARVYKIWNDKLEVFRAVKIMLPTSDKKMRERFETEVKISAKLRHPNIVEIFSVGEWQGLPYIEMELIEGESLEAIINHRGRLPEAVAVAIGIFVAKALNYAHTQNLLLYGKTYRGLIHRDLKPANIMISKSGDVKLMDFGIARPTETSLHTVAGSIVGTLPYLAPEQLDGETSEMDSRVDIYACGTILYEMITGTKTFPQSTITNLMKSKITNDYRRFDDFEFSVTAALAKIVHKCLQVSKENRYTTAQELLEALEEVFGKLSSASPQRVIQIFLTTPESLCAPHPSSRKPWPVLLLRPAVLAPAIIGTMALVALIAVLLLTGSRHKVTASRKPLVPAQSAPNITANEATKPSPPPLAQASGKEDVLKPLEEVPTPPQSLPPTPSPTTSSSPIRQQPPLSSGNAVASATKPQRETSSKTPAAAAAAESPIDKLKRTYLTDDAFAAACLAFQKQRYGDVVLLLQSLPSGHPEAEKRDVMLVESLVETGRLSEAIELSNSSPVKDAQLELAVGKAFLRVNNYPEALKRFENSLIRPTQIGNRTEIIKNALYHIGLVRSALYRQNPSVEMRQPAWEAWRKVKEFIGNPEDPRYKKATEELAAIK